MKKGLSSLCQTLMLIFFTSNAIASSGAGVTYHGRLVGPDGNAVIASSVQFRLQVRTPGSENCLLYEEIQNKDMSASNGVFAVTINDGSGSRQDTNTYSIDQIFANRGAFTFPAGYCIAGVGYSPNATDGRKLQVYFNDGTFAGWEPVPAQEVNFVPMAIESMQVGGYKKENLIKVATGVDTTGFDLSAASFAELIALATGSSTQFVKPGAASFTAAPQWSGTPTGANDLANKSYVDAQVAAGLPNFGTAGTYTKVTTDAKGRVSSGTTLAATDIPALDASKITSGVLPIANGGTNSGTALAGSKVMVSSATSIVEGMASNTAKSNNTFVMRDGSGNIAGALGTFDGLSVLLGGNIALNGATSGSVSLVAPTSVTSYTMTLPTTAGTTGQVLTTNGTGILSWTTASGGLPASGGTAAAPGYAFVGNTNTGMFNPAANELGFATNGAEVLRIDATGKLGIGTTSPATKIDIKAASSNEGIFSMRNSAGTIVGSMANHWDRGQINLYDSTGNERTSLYTDPNDGPAVFINVNSQNKPDGPGTAFGAGIFVQVPNVTGNENGILFSSGPSGAAQGAGITYYVADSASYGRGGLKFKTSNSGSPTTRMTITETGNVGIGSTSPTGTLDVTGTAGLFYRRSGASSAIGMTDYSGSMPLITLSGTDNSVPTGIASAGQLKIYAGSTNLASASAKLALVADTNGYVGVGNNAPSTALDITGAVTHRGMAAPAVSPVGQGRIYFDSTSNTYKASQNGAAYTDLVGGGSSQWTTSASDIYYSGGSVGVGTSSLDSSAYLTIKNQVPKFGIALVNPNAGGIPWYMASSDNGWSSGGGKFLISKTTGASGASFAIDNAGNVGIGTTNPGANLQVESTTGDSVVYVRSTTNGAALKLDPYPGNSTNRWNIQASGGGSNTLAFRDAWNAVDVMTMETGAGVNRIYVKSGGNVGIGTTSPAAPLSVVGAISALQATTNATILGDTTGNARGPSATDLQAYRTVATQVAGGNYAVAVGAANTANGDNGVAIGSGNTTNSNDAVAIGRANSAGNNTGSVAIGKANDSNMGGISLGRANTTSSSTAVAVGDGNTVSAAGAGAFGSGITNSVANSVMVGPSNTAKLTILSSGNVGVGTTAPAEALEVTGNIKLSGAIVNQEAWVAPSYLNSWVDYGGGVFAPAGYFKDKNGIVHLRGLMKAGTCGAPAFTLPVGYRPAYRLLISTVTNTGTGMGRLDVTSTGDIQPDATFCNNSYFSIDGVSFRAEQ